MRRIAIVGGGQAGLPLALGLLDKGYEVTVVTNREPDGFTADNNGERLQVMLSLAEVGEESLARLTRLFAEESDRQIDGALSTVEPGLAAFLTLSVGVILLAVMLPLIGIMGAIG